MTLNKIDHSNFNVIHCTNAISDPALLTLDGII